MAGIDDIIGGWVKDAEASGAIKQLPGYGKPLELEDDKHVPAKYRMSFRILKNAGYTPPEVEMLKRVGELQAQIDEADDEATRTKLRQERDALKQKLDVVMDKFKQA